ncbi:hypothetical protein J22TS1_11490 [Siminovitchia terrae]|nr:hypothetical protein J22TS1_11490 [Siminovitchia terrae]
MYLAEYKIEAEMKNKPAKIKYFIRAYPFVSCCKNHIIKITIFAKVKKVSYPWNYGIIF